MDHFIITRFNLRKVDWKRDKSTAEVLDEDWLEERIKLFLNFCFPSVVNQRSRNFKWLIFFEKDSRPKLGRVLEKLNAHSFIIPVFVEGYNEFQEQLPIFLQEIMSKGARRLITTRLDNDDAIHEDFVKETQELLEVAGSDTILHFPYGLCFQHGNKNKLALQYYPLNQFLSLQESVDGVQFPKTVCSTEHDKWGEDHRILSGGDRPRWLQVVHNRNMMNRFKGSLVFKKHLMKFHVRKSNFEWDYDLKIFLEKLSKKLNIFRS